MKKFIPFSLAIVASLVSIGASAGPLSATGECAAGAAAASVIGFPATAYAYSVSTKEGRITGGAIAATGCAVGTLNSSSAEAAEISEAPDETELKSDDIQTLQDARDLQNQ